MVAGFIAAHRTDDVRRLALQLAGRTDIDVPWVLDQIAGWQTARRKLPSWAATDGITYPPHLSMEQCSGEPAARYKSGIARRLAGTVRTDGTRTRLVDITGGLGVDFSFMARAFDEAVYIERQERLCDIARSNLPLLGLPHATVVCGDGGGWLERMEGRATVVFADPARRDNAGGRTFAIGDCTPDVGAMMPMMLQRADHVVLKLSPMLDWRKAVADIGPAVSEVHIVSTGGECKELLMVVTAGKSDTTLRLVCVNDSTTVETTIDSSATARPVDIVGTLPDVPFHLYEPNASVMKAGIFGVICQRYGVRQIGRDSHLFVSEKSATDFPGRAFTATAVTTMNKRELRETLRGITRANITVRCFPMTVAELRRRLKLADGGDVYLFGTTDGEGRHVVIKASATNPTAPRPPSIPPRGEEGE